MESGKTSDKQHDLWCLSAMLAPAIHSASADQWLSVVLLGGAGLLFTKLLGNQRRLPAWTTELKRAWGAAVAGILLGWTKTYWTGLPFGVAVPYVILALALWTIWVPGKSVKIGILLLYPLIGLLGAVLLSGVTEIKWKHLMPTVMKPNWMVLTVFLFPLLKPTAEKRRGSWKAYAIAAAASIITAGVLTLEVSRSVGSGIYELSRSLSLLGTAERFESLIAAGMTLGSFLSVTYLLETNGSKEKGSWLPPAIALLTSFLSAKVPEEAVAIGSVMIWGFIPTAAQKLSEKTEKRY